jgi:hypothetical protein
LLRKSSGPAESGEADYLADLASRKKQQKRCDLAGTSPGRSLLVPSSRRLAQALRAINTLFLAGGRLSLGLAARSGLFLLTLQNHQMVLAELVLPERKHDLHQKPVGRRMVGYDDSF